MNDEEKYIQYRSCLRKKKLSKIAADWLIEKIAKQNKVYYYYSCKFCGKYHLTKNEPFKVKHS